MSVEVALAPRNNAQLQALLADLYNTKSPNYQHWLGTGEFVSRFAPTAASTARVAKYLTNKGLRVRSPSPFLVRAEGSSAAISAAFRTELRTYRSRTGVKYYSNASSVQMPADLAAGVLGVVGLTNTVRARSSARHISNPARRPAGTRQAAADAPTCLDPYPTAAQQFALLDNGIGFPSGYGGGPGCSGLTPSQLNSIYSAPNVGARGKGAGVKLGLFELSAYQQADIAAWAHTFYGAGYTHR
jgi:subtilase family serine protease